MGPRKRSAPAHDPYGYDSDTLQVMRYDTYVRVTVDGEVRAVAMGLAKETEGSGVTWVDLHQSRAYLRACLSRMSVPELEKLDVQTAAALWAAGACGCYRRRRQHHDQRGHGRDKGKHHGGGQQHGGGQRGRDKGKHHGGDQQHGSGQRHGGGGQPE